MASTVYVANPNNARIATRTSTNNLKTGVYDENVANNGSISTQSFLGTKLSVAATKPVANLTAKRTTLGDISNFMKVDAQKAAKTETSKPSVLPATRIPLQAKPTTVSTAKTSTLMPVSSLVPKTKINTTTTISLGISIPSSSFLDVKLNTHPAKQDEITESEEKVDEESSTIQNQNICISASTDPMDIEGHSKSKQLSADYSVDEEVEDIDECDQDDPQFCTEYVTHIFEYLRQKEVRDAVNPRYMEKQLEIVEKHRTILVDWMAEVAVKFKLLTETMFLSINMVDRFLQQKPIPKQKLQLVGVTAMLIASKYEEIYTPEVQDFIYITAKAYTQEDVLKMERLMLVSLDFNLSTPTPVHFLRRFSKAARSDSKIHTLSKYLIELSLLEYKMLEYLPSITAAAAVYIARKMCKITPLWNSTLEFHTGYTAQEIMPCVRDLNGVVKIQNLSKHKSVYNKYASPNLLSVATIPVCEDL